MPARAPHSGKEMTGVDEDPIGVGDASRQRVLLRPPCDRGATLRRGDESTVVATAQRVQDPMKRTGEGGRRVRGHSGAGASGRRAARGLLDADDGGRRAVLEPTPMLGAEQRNAARTDPVGEAQAEPAPGRDAAQRRVAMILTMPRTARDQHVVSPALVREDRVQWTCLGFQPHWR